MENATPNDARNYQLKQLLCQFGSLSRPDGSATLCLGDTVVLAAAYGPRDVNIRNESATEANIAIVYKPKAGVPGCPERLQEHIVKNSCASAILATQYPRTQITVVLQEMQDAGCLLTCLINAACLALMDSGIAMKCLVAGVTCILDDAGEVILDPASEQQKEAKAVMMFVFDSRDYSIITSNTEGIFSTAEYTNCTKICRDASKSIFDFYRASISRKYSKNTS